MSNQVLLTTEDTENTEDQKFKSDVAAELWGEAKIRQPRPAPLPLNHQPSTISH